MHIEDMTVNIKLLCKDKTQLNPVRTANKIDKS